MASRTAATPAIRRGERGSARRADRSSIRPSRSESIKLGANTYRSV